MGIFIEGGIGPPRQRRTPKDGVATLALKTGAPVIPAYISGINFSDGIFRSVMARHRARVRMGPPVDLSEFENAPRGRETIRAVSQKIYEAIWALAPPEERLDSPPPEGDFSEGERLDGARAASAAEDASERNSGSAETMNERRDSSFRSK